MLVALFVQQLLHQLLLLPFHFLTILLNVRDGLEDGLSSFGLLPDLLVQLEHLIHHCFSMVLQVWQVLLARRQVNLQLRQSLPHLLLVSYVTSCISLIAQDRLQAGGSQQLVQLVADDRTLKQ